MGTDIYKGHPVTFPFVVIDFVDFSFCHYQVFLSGLNSLSYTNAQCSAYGKPNG